MSKSIAHVFALQLIANKRLCNDDKKEYSIWVKINKARIHIINSTFTIEIQIFLC